MPSHSLPRVEAPSLDNLEVQVQAAPLPIGDDMVRRLHEILRRGATRRELSTDQTLQPGDEVDCDIILQVGGRLIPGAIQRTPEFELRELPVLPGLVEALVGMTPFAKKTAQLQVSEHHPDPELAGQLATVHIETRQAYRVDMPALDDALALQRAGLGENIDEAMTTIAGLLDSEQGEELMSEATEAVLDALAQRVPVDVPSPAVDQELTLAWNKGPGALLSEKDFPSTLFDAARDAYLQAPASRAEAQRNIKVNLALAALVEQEQLSPDVQIMETLLEAVSHNLEMTPEEAKRSLSAEPELARKAAETALHLKAVEYVMARAKINVIDAS